MLKQLILANTIAFISVAEVFASPIVYSTPIEYITPAASSTKDGIVNAEAFFSLGADSLIVTLKNLYQNPTADGQEISAIIFDISQATGTGTLTSLNSGYTSTITTTHGHDTGANGTYTTGTSSPLLHWIATGTSITSNSKGTAINLTTLSGGQPNELIIGPDSKGGFNSATDGGGLYSNANSSISQHNDSVLGTGIFTISIPGVTSLSQISDVQFQFGTTAGRKLVTGTLVSSVPVPGAIWLMLSSLIGVLGLNRRKSLFSI
jgi:hypothetical protein